MKKKLPTASVAALLLVSLPLTAVLAGCKGAASEPAWTEPVEIVTLPELTIPEKPDERPYTDLSPYSERIDTLFANAAPTPAENFTYTVVGEGTPDLTFEGTVTITGYTGGDIVVVIPDTIEGRSVTVIAENAFADKTFIEAISVPDTVLSIGKGAFKGCKSLKSLRTPIVTCVDAPFFGALFGADSFESNYTVPSELSTLVISSLKAPQGVEMDYPGLVIPKTAFYNCRSLEVIALPADTCEIGDFAFYGCQSLTYLDTAETRLTSVGRNAFTNCSSLLTLNLPTTVETLGFAMLEGCGKLESLTLPFAGGHRLGDASADTENATYLGYLFGAADYTLTEGFIPATLISVTLQKDCGDVPPNAFFGCSPIREIALPEGVTAISRRAFYGCEGLSEMSLPNSVTTVGDDAFGGCIRLTAFTGGESLRTLGIQAFMNCISLQTVILPDTVTHLPNSCFAECISLESFTANGVSTEGKQVFRNCHKLGSPTADTTAPSSEN